MRDAGIYKLTDDLAIIQHVDFFTPIVDDPYVFGQVAAANALSDIYAMGGTPLLALNIVCFPVKTLDMGVLREILAGGLDKVHEAGAVLAGGHSIDDPEPKYGLAVTGTIHPKKIVFNTEAKVGDRLILTKPLGTGIISTAIKAGKAGKKAVAAITKSMTALNRKASELMLETGVNACTDVTGFGLLGHAANMVDGSDVGMVINSASVPFFPEAKGFAEKGLIPGGLQRNRDYRMKMLEVSAGVPKYLADILFDPQTSGGLLIAVPERKASELLKRMQQEGIREAAIIGEVVAAPKGIIVVK